MANELTLTAVLRFLKNSISKELEVENLSLDVSGDNAIHNSQTVGTSEEALVLGDAGAGGYLIAVNRDSTNFVELRPGSGIADLVKIGPGEVAMFRLAADATPYAIADTASCLLEYLIVEA